MTGLLVFTEVDWYGSVAPVVTRALVVTSTLDTDCLCKHWPTERFYNYPRGLKKPPQLCNRVPLRNLWTSAQPKLRTFTISHYIQKRYIWASSCAENQKSRKPSNLLVLMPLCNFQIVPTAKRFQALCELAYRVIGNSILPRKMVPNIMVSAC